MGIGNFIQIVKPTDMELKQRRFIHVNKKGEATLCWKKDRDSTKTTPSIITSDPEIIIGMLRTGGQIRMNAIGDDGSVANGTNLINGDKRDIVKAFVYGYETTVPDLFVRSNWHKSEPPTREELKAIGHDYWLQIRSGDPNWVLVDPSMVFDSDNTSTGTEAGLPQEAKISPEFAPEEVSSVLDAVDALEVSEPLKTSVQCVVEQRLHQDEFRRNLEKIWGNQCAVTNVTCRACLVASHIKPWAECSDKEKLDPYNGFLLNSALDALFDKHLITFDKEGKILISSVVDEASLAAMGISTDMKLRAPFDFEKYKPYLEHHWEEFSKNNPG